VAKSAVKEDLDTFASQLKGAVKDEDDDVVLNFAASSAPSKRDDSSAQMELLTISNLILKSAER
jgi:hypothetical protein